ncbi:ATP synthase subunit I [Desulfitibacter alkalitolerans]|uniref:ATP synthase subunit I n=1 Tax=Desulfitibacter alkalitolerans TaxID=264641 RepID=UPI000487016C|nr:ATP synthase subunit I [Desulfitibacter alkalitolerans]
MNQSAVAFYKDKKLRLILILAVTISTLTYIFGQIGVAAGVLAATPLGVFNYWMMWDAVQRELANKEANKMLLGRSLIRMVISIIALVAAVQVGIGFLFGVMLGLFLHLFTYTFDVLNILTGKKYQ